MVLSSRTFVKSDVTLNETISYPRGTFQGSKNCAHGDEHARNVHTKRLSREQNYWHVNQ